MTETDTQGTPSPTLNQPAVQTPAALETPTQETPASNTQTTIDPTRLAELERMATAYSGSSEMIRAMATAGIKTADDIASLQQGREAQQLLDRNNINLPGLQSMFAGEATQVEQPVAAITMEDINGAISNQLTNHSVNQEHESLVASENAGLSKITADILGKNTDPTMAGVVKFLVENAATEARSVYPANHPLRNDSFAPLSAAQITQIGQVAQKAATGLMGSNLVAKAQAAQAVMAGPAGLNGLQSPNPSLGDSKVPFRDKSMAEKTAAYSMIEQQNNGNPLGTIANTPIN